MADSFSVMVSAEDLNAALGIVSEYWGEFPPDPEWDTEEIDAVGRLSLAFEAAEDSSTVADECD